MKKVSKKAFYSHNNSLISATLEDIKKQIASPPKPTKPKAQTAPAPSQKSEAMKELIQLASFTTRK